MTFIFFFFSSRRRHTRFDCDWSSDVCSSDLSRAGSCVPVPRSRDAQKRHSLVRLRRRSELERANTCIRAARRATRRRGERNDAGSVPYAAVMTTRRRRIHLARIVIPVLMVCTSVAAQRGSAEYDRVGREILKELVETDTTQTTGNTTLAAERMAG